MPTRTRLAALAALAAGLLVPLAPASAKPAPCKGKAAADEWPTFGRDLSNSRHQESPGPIGAASAPLLAPVWSFSTGGPATGLADLNGTPIVAAGCVFLNTADGDVIALDATTGEQVWRRKVPLDPGASAGLGGIFVSSPAVTNGEVIGLVNQSDAPYAIALSRRDGSVVWRSEPLRAGAGYYTNATPVVYEGLVLAGFSPAEGDPQGRGGVVILDAETGAELARAMVVPDEAFAQGYAGAGVWTAPAIDTATGYAYAGTGNPYSKKIEHPNTNAIVKIDIDRSRPTFGTVVGSYKGDIEQLSPQVRDAIDPVCEATGEEEPAASLIVGNSATCLQLDLDFGAPPNLFTDASGRLLIGDLQKSGVYHAADAATMAPAWSAPIGVSCAACNAAATAWDGDSLYGVGTPGSAMVSLTTAGAHRWASPVGDGLHYQSTTSAGGAVFTIDGNGFLLGFDAATGVPLLRRPVTADVPDPSQPPVALSSSGIAVASGTLYVAAGNAVIAYRPLS